MTDPEDPYDLLVGHFIPVQVEGARTYYYRDEDDHTQRRPRMIVLDEFPDDTDTSEFGEEFLDHAR